MSSDVCVQNWSCSYYLTSEKRWIPGRLSLTPSRLKFKADGAHEFLVSFHLSSINEIKKESSSYIFSSITVLEKDQAKHWFSSLQPNRNVAFNVIQHFWREQLLTPQGSHTASSKTSQGGEFVNRVTASQSHMEESTNALLHQGEQFDNIRKGLDKIEADMATTDRLLSVLESPSWWLFSRKPWQSWKQAEPKESPGDVTPPNHGKEGILMSVPIIFSRKPDINLKPGKLTVLTSALEISDCNSQLLHRYQREDVDDITVCTGYDISIRQRFIGKPDITYKILSAKLPDVIPLLEMQYSKKIEFLEEALMFSGSRRSSPRDQSSPETGTPFPVHISVSSSNHCLVARVNVTLATRELLNKKRNN
ncbi:synaptosome associated protein 47kDa L homeolog [Xenopus laevis]|uniref:Synaptosomal-associated protein 47 n=1 Tax=Xenopus laevis TaxID=8355 RepID=A1L3G1_XENLA|nr:synaptosome associated protein 47kDa L homeolog [Xenopus laevis]AAI30078.1 LOC100036996 protein [Xenopus laevis]